MHAVGESPAIPRDGNLLFSPAFSKHSDGEFVKYREYMNPDLNQAHHIQQPMSSGLGRYRSAPSYYFSSVMEDGTFTGGAGFQDLLNSSGDAEPYGLQHPGAVKQEIVQKQNQYSAYRGSVVVDHRHDMVNSSDSLEDCTDLVGLYKVADGTAMEGMSSGDCSSLARQSSSPAGVFSNLTMENGYAVMRDMGNYRAGNRNNGKCSHPKMLNDHMHFSSGQTSSTRHMPHFAENRIDSSSTPENRHLGNVNGSKGFYAPTFQNRSWHDSTPSGLKRSKEGAAKFSSFSPALDNQSCSDRNYHSRLTHHLSLPKISGEMAAVEKYLQFQQDAVPCKIRAKRGCATHPRSIAERMRRTRISDRMKKLQDLFPDMDKQMNTADMLDLAVEYIKDLQNQVQVNPKLAAVKT